MVALSLFALLASASLAVAGPAGSRFGVHESRASAPEGFAHVGPAPTGQLLSMRLNLRMNDIEGLENALNAASDPTSATFRQWLTKEQTETYAKPTDETTAAVKSWLSANGITAKLMTPAGDWLGFDIPVSKANEMFNAKYNTYTHKASGRQTVRTLEYSLPVDLHEHINAVHPTTSFNAPKGGLKVVARGAPESDSVPVARAAAATCSASAITPACLQSLYTIPTTAATNKNNSMAITAYDDQFAYKPDLQKFLAKYRTDMSSATTFGLISIDGGVNTQKSSSAGVEANLDIQYTVGLATNVPAYFIAVGDNCNDGTEECFGDTITSLIGETAPPLAISTSYGLDVESDLSRTLSISLCNSYMQLTSRGVTITFATGDGGVASTPGVSCSGKAFPPTFPTCPYVTLVGATGGIPEKGASLSAGGFSNYFAQASWQATAVSTYLKFLGTTYSGKYNATGRAYPDVAAMGESVEVYVSGSPEPVDGTSCSSPIFTSVVALINEQLLNAGKPVLGFLNPWLYANPGAFNDITSGTNPGCGTNGFSATTGWDPVTGLGTPNYAKLVTAAGL